MRRVSAPPNAVWLCLLGAILCFFGAHVGRYWGFTVDDAGVSFAYARNLAAGHGMVLTPGSERVEAATDLLWVLLLSPADALHLTHETLARVLGLLSAGGALVGIAFFPAVAYRRRPALYDLVAPLVAALFVHSALWCIAGLENGLFQLLSVTSVLLLAWEEHDEARPPWSAVSLAALFATRPDGALYAFAIGAAKFLRLASGRRRRQDAVWGITLGLLVGGLELFRLAYFAYPFPNSFYIKRKTFEFGSGITDKESAGWQYVGAWVHAYGFAHALMILPCVLLALRAPIARIGLVLAITAGFFFPVYSHGDWMEEWRFLSLVAPLTALGVAEAARSLARIVVTVSPRAFRRTVAFVLTPLAAYAVLRLTTHAWPDRVADAQNHTTLEFAHVRQRARYFATATRLMEITQGSVLDPDVGGEAYDSGLRVVDLYGLADTAITHSHDDDEPGMREVIFWERRPSFVHLHGAWFGAVQLDRLEEITKLYFTLPAYISTQSVTGTNYVRRDAVAAPWTEEAERGPLASTHGTSFIDGYTVSARGLEPGQTVTVEVTIVNPNGGPLGSIVAEPQGDLRRAGGGGHRLEVPVHPAGDLLAGQVFLPGERLRAQVHLRLAPGTYDLHWKDPSVEASLGTVTVWRGTGLRELNTLRGEISQAIAAENLHEARRLALALRLRVHDLPDDALSREALALYARALANRARVMGEHQAFTVATDLAHQARWFAPDDDTMRVQIEGLAERMSDAARDHRRQGDLPEAFTLARNAVLIDPRRSWMRRQAEELRLSRLGNYDGGRDGAAYRTAAGALAQAVTLDAAVSFLGSTHHWIEAAALVDRAGVLPVTPMALLAAARGYLSRGEIAEAQALVHSIPCAEHRDPEFSRAFEAVTGHSYRRGDARCDDALPTPPPPFDALEGSFEGGRWRGWQATGRSFTDGPAHGQLHGQTFVNGWRGRYYASSWGAGDASRGTLRSRPFVITTEGLSFLVGGGSDTAHVGVRLMVAGVPVIRQGGDNDEALRRVFWNLRPWLGQTAGIEVYDDGTDSWGHIMVDDFRTEPVLPLQ